MRIIVLVCYVFIYRFRVIFALVMKMSSLWFIVSLATLVYCTFGLLSYAAALPLPLLPPPLAPPTYHSLDEALFSCYDAKY